MRKLKKKIVYQFLAFLVPLFTFLSPPWLLISGIGPRWAQLWLLPWALEEGPVSGAFAGLYLGLVLDGMNLAGSTQIPALILLGLWWGRLGRKENYVYKKFSLGFFAWLGVFVSGLSIWLQTIFFVQKNLFFIFNAWFLHNLFAGAILNALIAPLLCPLIMKYFLREKQERYARNIHH
ncbi:rod shape-determining protein MreD [Prochlorococcus marinus]|uniref:rod shape-determining protein MreD n=1 Tax=Prochlorococcus marinus TaxID=1219 RepID=UPI0022B47B26|nr:rod shape-determining protein MreD [Prochlorococcus marinus]